LAVVLALWFNVAVAQGITPAKEAPAGSTVVEAFSKQHAMCEGLTEWTVDATPDDWINIGAKWVAVDEATAQDNWQQIAFVITVDGQEIADPKSYEHGPMAFSIACGDETTTGGAMGLEIYLPPQAAGDHVVTWTYIVEADLNDGWDDYPAGTEAMFSGTVRVAAATLPLTGGSAMPPWVVFALGGGVVLLGGLILRRRRA
jgi:LPXTG-motif cell wall-anchored protein